MIIQLSAPKPQIIWILNKTTQIDDMLFSDLEEFMKVEELQHENFKKKQVIIKEAKDYPQKRWPIARTPLSEYTSP